MTDIKKLIEEEAKRTCGLMDHTALTSANEDLHWMAGRHAGFSAGAFFAMRWWAERYNKQLHYDPSARNELAAAAKQILGE